MKNKNQIELLLEQISDMIKLIEQRREPFSANLTPEVLQHLEKLEKVMGIFQDLNHKSLEEARINIDNLRVATLRSSTIPEKDKALIERAKKIEKDARQLQLHYSLLAKGGSSGSGKNQKKQMIKNRKKKFKPMGGNKGWIPL